MMGQEDDLGSVNSYRCRPIRCRQKFRISCEVGMNASGSSCTYIGYKRTCVHGIGGWDVRLNVMSG